MRTGRQNVSPPMISRMGCSTKRIRNASQVLGFWFFLGIGPAFAQPEHAVLLDRIHTLERRLVQLERSQSANRGGRATSRPTATPQAALPTDPPALSRAQSLAPPSTSRARDPQEEEIPQEAFIFRDQAVTLRPGRVELSLDLGYLRDRRAVSHDRSASAVLTGRVGIVDGVEASVTAPFFNSTRSFDHSPSFTTDRETRGIGDVAVQFNVRAWGERPSWPGAVVTAGLVAPTGPSPFLVSPRGISAQQVPVDITQLVSARGAWALRGGIQFFKTLDPIVLFGGISYEYAFPVEQSGITFRPGWRINYNAGVSFALSERSTLGFTFIGNYTAALQANRVNYRTTASEAAILRLSLIQRVMPNMWVEPSLGMGLVSESPNLQIGLGLRYRF